MRECKEIILNLKKELIINLINKTTINILRISKWITNFYIENHLKLKI